MGLRHRCDMAANFTAGTPLTISLVSYRTYARAIVELLDPTGDLFGGRIIASSATTEDGAPVDQAKSLMLARSFPWSHTCWK